MFARVKKSGNYQYVQVVHNERVNGQVRQRVIATLGRLDVLKETGQLDQLLESLARLSDHVAVLNALKTNQITPSSTVHLGPPLVFEKLWKQLGMPDVLRRLLDGRRFEFPVERVVVSRTGSLGFRIGFVFPVCHGFPGVVSQYSFHVQLSPEPS